MSHSSNPSESPDTYQARKKIKQIFTRKHYEIEEEVPLETVTNNMDEEIWPPYQADMLLTKQFIIELDPQSAKKYKAKGHGTKIRRNKDHWKDTNIKNQINLKVVRLEPEDILKDDSDLTLTRQEIHYQLGRQQQGQGQQEEED
jgi:hypothetical protein